MEKAKTTKLFKLDSENKKSIAEINDMIAYGSMSTEAVFLRKRMMHQRFRV
jgi:hypothetical protein